jgi:hypothetical protein
MEFHLRISSAEEDAPLPRSMASIDDQLRSDLLTTAKNCGARIVERSGTDSATPIPATRTRSRRDVTMAPTDVVVALGSAGIFTAIYKVITTFIDRNKSRSVSLSVGNKKITITGHNMPEEVLVLNAILPELVNSHHNRAS